MANARKILIVDDDTDLRDTLVEQLSLHDEFEASAVDTGAKGATAAKTDAPDLVLMDVGLPDTDGREVVRSLRKGGFKAPIIMLTGHDTDSDTILGLESGANDYVAKPFRFAVLLARIRAQLRQHEASEDAVFSSVTQVREGQRLSSSLEGTRVFPELAIEMIEVGESTGALPAMLNSVAGFFEEDVDTSLAGVLSLIEPTLLIFMGVVVAVILISLYLPILQLGAGVNGAAPGQ